MNYLNYLFIFFIFHLHFFILKYLNFIGQIQKGIYNIGEGMLSPLINKQVYEGNV